MISEQPGSASLLDTGGAAGPSSTQPRPCTPSLSLIDMPAPWLDQLLGELAPQHYLDLFRVCRALRDLVLSERTLKAEFELPLEPDAAAAAQAKLVLACQRSPHVKLILIFDNWWPPRHETAASINASAGSLMLGAKEAMLPAQDRGLLSVRTGELLGLELDTLVPPWLSTTCPNLTSLELESCHMAGPPPPTTAAIPTCSQLHQLTVTRLHDGHYTLAQWQQQFRALTGLNSLTLGQRTNPRILKCASPIGTQLTQLAFWDPASSTKQRQLPAWFPNLTELHLTNSLVNDEGVEELLGLQHLTQFECSSVSVQRCYRTRPCRWKHLGVQSLEFNSFYRLPLAGLRCLRSTHGWLQVYPCTDQGVASRVLAIIGVCGGIQWSGCLGNTRGIQVLVEADNQAATAGTARLVDILPLIASCQPTKLSLHHCLVTLGLLAAFQHHLPHTLVSIKLSSAQGLGAPGVWRLLLPSLPPSVEKVELLHCKPAPDEEAVMEMCAHASRPVRLSVVTALREGWAEGWAEGRVQAAMAAAGHQHVRLEVVLVAESEGEDEDEEGGEDGSDEDGDDDDDEG